MSSCSPLYNGDDCNHTYISGGYKAGVKGTVLQYLTGGLHSQKCNQVISHRVNISDCNCANPDGVSITAHTPRLCVIATGTVPGVPITD